MSQATRAIADFCKSCIYDQGSEGTWREQVMECTAKNCPIYSFRPLPTTPQGRAEKTRMRQLCSDRYPKKDTGKPFPRVSQ